MKITEIEYDDCTRYEDEIEIAPWNIVAARKLTDSRYFLKMSDSHGYYITKEDYEKVLKYIKRREKYENTNR